MAKLGTLSVDIIANVKEFTKAMGRVKKGVAKVGKSIFSLPGLATGVGAGLAAKQLLEVGDAYVNLDARLTNLTGTASQAADVQQQLYEMSQRTGTAVLSNADAFTKLQIAQGMTGLSADENIEVLEGLNKVFALSGASALDTSIAMRQLGQSLASGRFQGDEFRSVAEAAPGLLVELAKELGVATGELKKMGSDGKLTSDVLGKAFLNIARTSEMAFQDMPVTSARAFQRIINSAQKMWDHVLDNTQLIPAIAEAFDDVAIWIENNEGRMIQWAVDFKEWVLTNWPIVKESLITGFMDVFAWVSENWPLFQEAITSTFLIIKNISEEVWPSVRENIRLVGEILREFKPILEPIVDLILKAAEHWGMFISALARVSPLTVGIKWLKTLLNLFTQLIAKAKTYIGLSRAAGGPATAGQEVNGETGIEGGTAAAAPGGINITNNFNAQYSRNELSQLSTDQTRQAARA